MDKSVNTQTFQSPAKSLKNIVAEIAEKYGATFRLQNNPGIETVVYQQQETDWAFLKRIAAQYQQEIYVNTRSRRPDMAIGISGLKLVSGEEKLKLLGVSKDIGEQRMVMANMDPYAVSYQYIKEEYLCENLTLIPGDIIGRNSLISPK